MGFLTGKMGMPAIVAILVILGESLGGVGFDHRIPNPVMCIWYRRHHAWRNGHGSYVPTDFSMNWSGNLPGEGFEYHLLAIAAAVPLIMNGGGKFSIDDMIVKMGFKTALIYRKES